MLKDVEHTFAAYSREELEQTLSSMDPEKNPGDYAAVQAAMARALPAVVNASYLDVDALRSLVADIRPSAISRISSFVMAIVLTLVLAFFFSTQLDQLQQIPTWAIVVASGMLMLMWASALSGAGRVYRFANGRLTYLIHHQCVWTESLNELVWVDRVTVNRYGEALVFHWPNSTRRVALELKDFRRLGVRAARA